MSVLPAYDTVSNLVVVVSTELQRFVDAHEAGEFHCVHNEMPYVLDLLQRAADLKDSYFSDLDAIQSWLLDVAIVGPQLWD